MTALLIATQRHSHLQPQYVLNRKKTRIGRHPDNDIAVMLESISRFHAEIEQQGNFHILRDAQSRNGTYLNGNRLLAPAPIRHGDRIQFGNVEFIFRPGDLSDDFVESAQDTMASVGPFPRAPSEVLHAKPVADLAPHIKAGELAPAPARAELLYQLAVILRNGSPSDTDTLKSVLSKLFEALPADRLAILHLEERGSKKLKSIAAVRRPESRSHSSPHIELSDSICQRALEAHEALVIGNVQGDERLKASESVATQLITSAICVPLENAGRMLGLLYADTQQPDNLLGETHLSFLAAVSAELSYATWLDRFGGSSKDVSGPVVRADAELIGFAARTMERIIERSGEGATQLNHAFQGGDLEEARGHWKSVRSGLKRLRKVLSEMQAYAKGPSPQYAEVNIHNVIDDTVEAFRDELGQSDIKLVSDHGGVTACRRLDEDALYRALINVVENAFEALLVGGSGGTIKIVASETDQGALLIEVKDDGPGISNTIQARAFQPFNSGTKSEGIGMGLASTRQLVESMSGSVTLSSETNGGTTVTIIFPASTRI